MSHTLFLSYDGMTDPLGRSQVLPYLEGLSAQGYSIRLISFEKPGREQKMAAIRKQCEAAGIAWHPLTYTKRPPVLSTLYDAWRMSRLARKLHKQRPFKLVHARSYISALVALGLKRRYGFKFIFDMRGFWADERVDGGLWPQHKLLYRRIYHYFKRKEQQFLQAADHTISLTHTAAAELHTWPLTGQPIPITVIPCCADLSLFDRTTLDESRLQQLREELVIPAGAPVLSYLGSVGTWYMLPEMLACFKALREQQRGALMLFISREPAEYILHEAAKQGLPPEALRIRPAEREEVPYLLALSQANLFFIKPVFSKKASSPTKQGEAMGMGLPIVCNAGVGDTDAIVRQTQTGHVLKGFAPEAYTAVAEAWSELMAIPKARIRQAAEEHYALQLAHERYQAVYAALLEN